MKKNKVWFIQVFSFVLIAGCLMVPVPTPEHGSYSYTGSPGSIITEDDIKSFSPGITKREDVLLLCGDPSLRLENDRYFVYCWERIEGYFVGVVFGPGYPVGVFPAAAPYTDAHLLCLEFTDDNKLKRFEDLDKFFEFRSCLDFVQGERPEYLENWLHPEK